MGPMTRAILTGSIVGVIIAERMAMITIANRQFEINTWALTRPTLART